MSTIATLYTLQEVADLLRVCYHTVWRKATRDYRRGDPRVLRIPPDSPRGVYRVRDEWIDTFFKR